MHSKKTVSISKLSFWCVVQAGALLLDDGDYRNLYNGDITFMGHVMAKLPVDICIAKLIVLGYLFSVVEECVIMGK